MTKEQTENEKAKNQIKIQWKNIMDDIIIGFNSLILVHITCIINPSVHQPTMQPRKASCKQRLCLEKIREYGKSKIARTKKGKKNMKEDH